MTFAQLREQIRQRLDQRTDLDQVIYDYVQDRVSYWQKFFFYSSDVVDTSVTTAVGTFFVNLPSGMRNVRRVRFLLAGPAVTTTTTSTLTLPAATIPVVSTAGFPTSSVILIAGMPISYTGVTATSFTGCTGGQTPSGPNSLVGSSVNPLPTTLQNEIASGTTVQTGGGVWIPLWPKRYEWILEEDVLSPPVAAIPSWYAQFGLQLRIYPTPSMAWPLEITGNSMPPAPNADTDDNFWTEDAAQFIINSVCAEICDDYLHEDSTKFRINEQREYKAIKKLTLGLDKPLILRSHL